MSTVLEMPGKEAKVMRTRRSPVTVLLLGASGQLGNTLYQHWDKPEFEGHVCKISSLHEAVDITNADALREQIKCVSPDVIINCAGYTNSRMAEEERIKCWRVNTEAVFNIVECCLDKGIDLVHLSSDFLFGLDKNPLLRIKKEQVSRDAGIEFDDDDVLDPRLLERTPAAPIGHLATTKLAAEHAILQSAADEPSLRYWILRTACMFEPPWRKASNFPYAIASALAARNAATIPVPNDVHTSICYTPQLANVITWLLDHRDDYFTRGVYHVANTGAPTLYDIARRVATGLRYPFDRIRPVSSTQLRSYKEGPTRQYTVLNTSNYEGLGGPKMTSWETAIDQWCAAAHDKF